MYSVIPEDHDNSVTWQTDNLDKLMTEIYSNQEGVLSKILDMRKTNTEYLEQANKADKQNDEIRTRALGLDQDLYISNKKREQAVTLLQE